MKNNFITNSPFFIFGCGRSGTSLLSRMLNQHSKLAVPYESHLFNTFWGLLKYYGDLSILKNRKRLVEDILKTDVMNDWEPRLTVDDVLLNLKQFSFGGIFDTVMNAWTKKNNKVRWGEKTPHHIYYWEEIVKIWPDAKIIHIYRDGRDVALSLLNARFGPKTIYSNAKYWVKYLEQVEVVKEKVDKQSIIELSYENLIENPEFELKKICNFLGEYFEINMLEFYKNRSDYNTDEQNKQNLKRPILKNNYGKWRKKMTPKEIRVFEAIGKDHLIKFGYSLKNENPKIALFENIFLGKVLSPYKKIIAMMKNKKGQKDSLIKLIIKIRLIIWQTIK